ncbi:MAG: hotdog fold thioesterase [Candidatus Nanopelagicales bacterium]
MTAEPPSGDDYIAAMNDLSRGSLAERMGIRFVEASADRVVATMPVEGNTQPYGLLHGGASVVLAETIGSVASVLYAGEGRIAVGIEISCSHHRGVTEGTVTGVATPLSRGRSLATYEIAITDDRDRRVATARLTCMLRDAVPGS